MRRQGYLTRYLAPILASELILWASLSLMGWRRTVTSFYSIVLLVVLLVCAVAGKTFLARWSHNRFRYGVTHLMLGYAILCGLVAILAAFYGRPYFDRYSTSAVRRLGVEVEGSSNRTVTDSDDALRDRDITSVTFVDDAMVNAALAHLRHFPNLGNIILCGGVTDAGLQRITKFKFSRDIAVDLIAPHITDDGLRQLRDCGRVTTIWINGAHISSRGIELLAGLEHVTGLGLLEEGTGTLTRIGDDAIRSIAGMDQLSSLVIIGPRVTDKSIAALGSLSNLDTLDLLDTQISDDGLSRLRCLIPTCRIRVRRNFTR